MEWYTIITGKGRGQKKDPDLKMVRKSTENIIKEVFYYENY
jgi:hypothetical protein